METGLSGSCDRLVICFLIRDWTKMQFNGKKRKLSIIIDLKDNASEIFGYCVRSCVSNLEIPSNKRIVKPFKLVKSCLCFYFEIWIAQSQKSIQTDFLLLICWDISVICFRFSGNKWYLFIKLLRYYPEMSLKWIILLEPEQRLRWVGVIFV